MPGLNLLRWLLTWLADTIAIAAILRHWPAATRTPSVEILFGQRWLVARHLLGFALFAAPLLTLGLQPPLLARWLGLLEPSPLFDSLWTQVRLLPGWMWLVQGLAAGLGFLLARWRPRLLVAQVAQQRIVAQIVDLDWLLAGLRGVGRGLNLASSTITGLLDGAGYVGWLALIMLLAWFLQAGS